MSERTRTRLTKGMSFDNGGRWEEKQTDTGSWYTHYKSSTDMQTERTGSETITDNVEYGDNHPMRIKKLKIQQFLAMNMDQKIIGTSGERRTTRVTVKNYRHFNFYDRIGDGLLSEGRFMSPEISQPSDSVLVTKLLAMTNPSVPVVSIPNFGHELRELPEIVMYQGRNFLERAAKANLQISFGLTPLVGDLLKLRDFTAEADKLFKQLNAVRKRGLRRTRVVWRGTANVIHPEQHVVEDFWLPVHARCEILRERVIKGHVRYVPTKDFPTTDDELRRRINQVVSGMSTDSANLALTAWNAMPWTWLIDWFSNTGDLMKRDVNILGLKPTGIRIMETDKCTQKMMPIPTSNGSLAWQYTTPHLSTFEQKVRRLPNNLGALPVELKLPLFNIRQLGILASLFVTRSGRYPDPADGLFWRAFMAPPGTVTD